jgi:hypothetical protein
MKIKKIGRGLSYRPFKKKTYYVYLGMTYVVNDDNSTLLVIWEHLSVPQHTWFRLQKKVHMV